MTIMSSTAEPNAELAAFVARAQDFFVALSDGRGSKVANTLTAKNDLVANQWLQSSSGQQTLLKLLSHQDSAVQFTAAAYLLRSTHENAAVSTLEHIKENAKGLVVSSSRLLLMRHRDISQAQLGIQPDGPASGGPAS